MLTLLACAIAVAAHKSEKRHEKRREPSLFLVTHAARSGSDWLLDLLNSHDEVCIPAGKTPSSKLDGCDHHALYEKCRAAELAKSGQRMDAYFEETSTYRLAHPSGSQKPTCRVFGWKQLMRDLAGGRAFDRESFGKWIRKRRVKMLLLRREGLAWYVSGQRHHRDSHADGLPSHCRTAKCAKGLKQTTVTLNPDSLVEHLDSQHRDWSDVANWTAAALPADLVHTVTYDDLVSDTAGELDAIFRFLGVAPNVTVASTYVKTSKGNVLSNIENTKEVRNALRGTPWEVRG